MANEAKTTEKVVTKYDRKIQERKAKEEKDKRDQKITKIVGFSIIALIIIAVGVSIGLNVAKKNKAIKTPYVKVGDYEITKVEYDFYYNTMSANYLSAYGSMASYFGLDTSKPFDMQQYSDEMTWQDFFDKMTIEQIRDIKACKEDAEAKGFSADTTEKYNAFIDGVEASAKEQGISVSEFYTKNFGEYASQKTLDSFIKETLFVDAYLTKLVDDNAPDDETVKNDYEENKKIYDLVDYRMFYMSPEFADDDSDEVKAEKTAEIKEQANELAEEIKAGADFDEAVAKYDTAETTEEDAHLIKNTNYGYISNVYADWLFDEARTEGDTELISDDDNSAYYVLQFVKRAAPDDINETIKNNIAQERVTEYKAELAKKYALSDIAGELNPVVFKED